VHNGFFQTFWGWLILQLNNYIAVNTALIGTAIEPAVVALVTLYIMAWGYLQLTGRIDEPVSTGLHRIVRVTVVLGVSLHLWLYNDLIVDSFYRAPAQLAGAVVGSGDPIATVDAIWSQGGGVAESLLKNGGGWNPSFIGTYAMAGVVWLLIGFLCVYVMFLIALSSIASAVLLAIGPVFITMFLFDATRRFFEAWIAQLANYALITILTVLVTALLLGVMQSYAAQTAARGTGTTLVDAFDMLLLAGLILLLMRQILPIAAALAGGLALSSLNAVSGAMRSGLPSRSVRGGAIGLYNGLLDKSHSDRGGQSPPQNIAERGSAIVNAGDLPAR
jgi:type IV secretion system protein VirB6